MSHHSKKRAKRATTPTTIFSKPYPPEGEEAVDAELEAALPEAVADFDAELSLLVALADDLETKDCEVVWVVVDEAASEA